VQCAHHRRETQFVRLLLFTDADTVHYPGLLAAAVREAEGRRVDLLSYSPEQEVVSFAERILMPLVFADLIATYPPDRVNDPQDSAVAANGQFILVRRAVYERLGGHACVADKLLEDVELARRFKASGHKIWFRYGGGMVRTRMYRSFQAMREGWTKNLALLFRHPLALSTIRSLEFLAITLSLPIALVALGNGDRVVGWGGIAVAVFFYLLFLSRVRRAHFPWAANLLSLFGLPLFVSLLLRSYLHSHRRGEVTWKGRTYKQSAPQGPAESSTLRKRTDLKS
jgi:Glycosyl transferase family 21